MAVTRRSREACSSDAVQLGDLIRSTPNFAAYLSQILVGRFATVDSSRRALKVANGCNDNCGFGGWPQLSDANSIRPSVGMANG